MKRAAQKFVVRALARIADVGMSAIQWSIYLDRRWNTEQWAGAEAVSKRLDPFREDGDR